jgi:hypothetical protein
VDRHRVDRIAVRLSTSRSRRKTLRLLAAGLVGSVVASRSPGPAAALILCPERVPDPAYIPTTNGCGPSGFGFAVPDRWHRADFTGACTRHDRCYATCNSDRDACDRAFLTRLRKSCRRAYPGDSPRQRELRRRCGEAAHTYSTAVSDLGLPAYEANQAEACLCCDEDGRGPKCGSVCCAGGLACADPASGQCGAL